MKPTHWLALTTLAVSACHCGNSGAIPEACDALAAACDPGGAACADHTTCEGLTADQAVDAGVSADAGCHVCAFTPRQCTQSAQCCPGQVCNTTLGACFDCTDVVNGACGQSDCQTDADCVQAQGAGRICAPFGFDGGPTITGEPSSQRCSYPTCTTNADCAAGASCFLGYCVLTAPCQGSCATGTACAVTDDFCSAVPAVPSCQQSCGPGTLMVFVNQSVPTGIYDACDLPAVACSCQPLPSVTSSEIGEWSALAQGTADVWVSAYDHTFGDLVAFHFDLDGGLLSLDYIDGLPDGGPVVGDPNGPRGGLTAPGPNVGEYTSIALGPDGQPRIAYYDVDHSALKYAARLSDGGWSVQTVDGPPNATDDAGFRDVGRTTSIAIAPNGAPAISYLELDAPDGGPSALDYALANGPAPQGASDWTRIQVQTAPGPCAAGCTAGQACVDLSLPADGGCATVPGGSCVATATTCTGCASTEACVVGADGGICRPVIGAASTGGVPIGVGLESSLRFIGGLATIAYGDSLHGLLMLAQQAGTGFDIATVDGRDPQSCANTGSVGRYPSLQAAPDGAMAIAYQDETRGILLYWTGAFGSSIAASDRIVLDPGTLEPADAGEDLPQIVGANASLGFGPSGAAYVAYQNQTLISLRLLSVPPSCATANPTACDAVLLTEWNTQPQGFFASLGLSSGTGFISNAALAAAPTGGTAQLLLEGPLSLP